MPRVVSLYIVSALIGFLASAILVTLIIVLNVANLRHLVFASDIAVIATLVFWILNGIAFSDAQFAFFMAQLGRQPD